MWINKSTIRQKTDLLKDRSQENTMMIVFVCVWRCVTPGERTQGWIGAERLKENDSFSFCLCALVRETERQTAFQFDVEDASHLRCCAEVQRRLRYESITLFQTSTHSLCVCLNITNLSDIHSITLHSLYTHIHFKHLTSTPPLYKLLPWLPCVWSTHWLRCLAHTQDLITSWSFFRLE